MRPASTRPSAAALAVVLLLAVVLGGCGALGPTASPDPACPTGDVRAPGTLPRLEALLPRGMIERSPDTLDSGWICSAAALGSYVAHGVTKLGFAGATWDQGNGNATVDRDPGARDRARCDVAWVEEFYTAGAVAGRHTGDVKTDRPDVRRRRPGLPPRDDQRPVAPDRRRSGRPAPYVHVVIVATTVSPDAVRADHDQRVEIAVEVAAGVPIS